MKSIFSVLAVIACSALGAQEKKPEYEPPKYQSLFEQTETGSDARGPGAGVDKFSDGADRLTVIRAICMSLYPSTEVRGDKVQSATVVCTNIEELRAAAGLLTKLVERDASEAWIISVIPEHIEPSVGLARFQKRRPKLKMHLSATERKVLVYGSEAEVRRVTENRNRSSEFQGQFKLKQIAPKDAGVFVRAMFPSAHADPKPNNVLAVSCEAEHANGVAALVAKLDGQNPTAPKKEQVEKQFDLKHVLAADLATTIQEAFATSKTRVVEERKLWVTADLDDKLAVEALVAAVDRPVASQDNEATFRVSQIDDTILLLGELYPSIEYGKLDGGPDNLSVRGDKATLQRISNLISNVATLKQREHTWSLLTVSDSGADKVSETLRRAMPKLFRHVGDAKNLLLVGGTADQIKEATEFLELSQFVESNVAHTGHANGVQPAAMVDAEQNVIEVIALRNVLAGEVSGMLNKLLVRTNVVTDAEAQSNSIVVSGSPTQIDSVKTLIAKLDVAAGKPSPVGQPMPPNTVVDPLAHESLVEDSHRLARSGDRDGLRKALQAEFEARQKMQVAQLAALKQKLQLLEQRIRTHETFKQQMIETRLQNLLRDPVMSEAKPKPAAENAKPGGLYKIQAGDTLGFVIENVLGAEGVAPPIHVDPTGVRGPVMGYPIPVRNDGTISLPLIKPVKVAGMTLLQLVNKVRGEYVNSSVLAEGQDYILATLIRSVDDQPARSTSPPTIKTPTASRRTSGKIAPGDTLGLVIEQILGNGDEPAPIHTDPTGARPPVMGYPIQVRADGTITLPYLGKVKVDGLSLGELEEKLETEFVGRDILMEGKTVIMVAMIRESSSPAREFVGTGTGWQTLDASGDEPKGRPSGIRQSFMNNLKSPSDFTDKEAELTIEIAQAEAGPIHELRSRRLEALRKEHKLVLSTIESDLKLAKARLVKAKETEAFQQRMAKRGYSTATETTAARLAVGAAEAELEQLQKLYEAYRGALQGEAGKEGSNAKEKNTSPSGPNATTSPDSTVKLALNFKAAPWAAVLKTLAEANKLNLNVQDSPPGTFSYQSGKQYTPQQALDVVAGHLLQDGYLTVRKDDFLTVWASENGLPPSLVPQASPEDLNTKYAGLDNVLLTVSFKVEGDVEELAREIDVLLDPQPFVRIAALNRSKTIIVTELSQNLRRVAKLLRPNKEETGFSKPSRTSGMFDAFDSFRSYERPGNSDRPNR